MDLALWVFRKKWCFVDLMTTAGTTLLLYNRLWLEALLILAFLTTISYFGKQWWERQRSNTPS